MSVKSKGTPVTSLRHLCERHGLIRETGHLRYGHQEMLQLLDSYMSAQEDRLARAIKCYKEQASRLESLSPKQTDFGFRKSARPPADWDFVEFKRRLIERDNAMVRATKIEEK